MTTTDRTNRRRAPFLVLAVLSLFMVAAAACGSDSSSSSTATTKPALPSGPKISIGAQDFPESLLLSEVYSQVFTAAGYSSAVQELGGYRDLLYGAFATGDVNFALEYAGSMLNYLAKPDKPAGSDVSANVEGAKVLLTPKNIVIAKPSNAVNANAFVMTKARSEELGITSLSDLAAKGASLKLGAPSDCETNPFCLPGLKSVYGVDLSSGLVALDDGRADALKGNQFDVAVLFSTDPPLASGDLVVLKDDKNMLPADNIVPVMAQALVDAYGQPFVDLVNKVSAALTTANVTKMNAAYVVDKEDAKVVAANFLQANGLG
jgi:osmoprotectant transport system substrate-binding protein